MKKIKFNTLIAATIVIVGGCGGGSGTEESSGDENTEEIIIPLRSIFANYINTTKSTPFSVTGILNSSGESIKINGTGNLSESSSVENFEEKTAISKKISTNGELTAQNINIPISGFSSYYYDSNYAPLGLESNGLYCLTESYKSIPEKAFVGTNGQWYSMRCFTNRSMQRETGAIEVRYSIESGTKNTSILILTSIIYDLQTGLQVPTTTEFSITPSGTIQRISEETAIYSGSEYLNLTISYH